MHVLNLFIPSFIGSCMLGQCNACKLKQNSAVLCYITLIEVGCNNTTRIHRQNQTEIPP